MLIYVYLIIVNCRSVIDIYVIIFRKINTSKYFRQNDILCEINLSNNLLCTQAPGFSGLNIYWLYRLIYIYDRIDNILYQYYFNNINKTLKF